MHFFENKALIKTSIVNTQSNKEFHNKFHQKELLKDKNRFVLKSFKVKYQTGFPPRQLWALTAFKITSEKSHDDLSEQ